MHYTSNTKNTVPVIQIRGNLLIMEGEENKDKVRK